MNKLIKVICIFSLIFISVYTSLFSYNFNLINNLIIFFTLIFSFLSGNSCVKSKNNTIKYLFVYIFWNMNYLVFIKHISSLDSLIDTILIKNVFIDILAVLAISNLILLITNEKKILNLIFSILLIGLYLYINNIILLYISIFLIGNTLTINEIKIKNKFISALNLLNIGILIFHKMILYLLLNSKIISPNISDFIGTLVLIYIVGFALSYYIKIFPVIRNII